MTAGTARYETGTGATTGYRHWSVRALRVAAVLEACSWAGLLVGMAFKYTGNGEAGVHLFGPVHGGLFMLYVALVLPASRALDWSPLATLAALLAAVPPFATLLVDRRLLRPVDAVPATS